MPVGKRTHVWVGCQVCFQPDFLRRTGATTAYLAAVRIEGNDMPGADVITVVTLGPVSSRRAKVGEVTSGTGSQILMIADCRAGDIFDAAPAGIVRLLIFRQRAVFVLNIAEDEDRCKVGIQHHIGDSFLTTASGCSVPAVKAAAGRVTGNIARRADHRVA